MEQLLDCRSCGACCVARGMPTMNNVDMTERDYARLAPRTRKMHVLATTPLDHVTSIANMEPRYRLKTVNGGCCSLLDGVVGERVKCTVYNQRPQTCREFEPGSLECHAFRKELGL